MSDQTYLATRVIRVGKAKYGPGHEIPEVQPNRLHRMIEAGDVVPADSPKGRTLRPAQFPAGTPTEPQETSEPEAETSTPEDAPDAETATESDHEYPVHTGNGWYLLSDGSRERGEENAHDAQAVLDALDG